MTLKTVIAAGCMVLTFGTWTSASQAGSPATTPTNQTGGAAGPSGDPSTHGTTDRAGQTPQPIGTGGTAVEQGKGGSGKPTNGTSDKKGKRKPKHGPVDKGGDSGTGGEGTKKMLAGGSAIAQNTSTTSSPTTGTTATTPGDTAHVSVIGCVQRTSATTADNTTTIVPDGDTRYMLSNITLAGRDAVSGRETRGTAGELIAEAVNMYQLDDSADSMIAPLVGDRVQVSGTVIPQPAGTSGRTGSRARMRGPLLKVEHIEKVSEGTATCVR